MDRSEIVVRLKSVLIEELNLEHLTPDAIDPARPLFGPDGLGLDSLDALQIAVAVEEAFGVQVPEGERAREVLASLDALVDHIVAARAAS